MTNLGLEEALAADGIALHRASVGDRHVLEMMKAHGAILGGETSGHIICLDRQPTGDGITSALQVLLSVQRMGSTLHAVKQGMTKYPQALVNVELPRPVDVLGLTEVQDAVRGAQAELAGSGRVLLRKSGTEPVVRVMVEGRDPGSVDDLAHRLASKVEEALVRAIV
jgi:phosphoglucosamine mutase